MNIEGQKVLEIRFMLKTEKPTPLRTGAALPRAAGPVRPVCWPKATSRRTRGKPTSPLHISQGMRKAPSMTLTIFLRGNVLFRL